MYKFDFAIDTNGRNFTSSNYTRYLSNGEKIHRNWLVYSIAKDSVFCFYCKNFATATSTSLAKDGYRDWRHIVQTLKNHKTTKKYENQKSWIELSIRLKISQIIDSTSQRFWNAETQHWNAVFQRLVSIVKLLDENCLAFIDSNENLYEHDNGIFLKLVQLLAEFHPVMEENVRSSLNKQYKLTTYLSKTIQNEVIHLIAHNVKSYILDEVKKSKYYSIILDSIPDLSKTEQMTFFERYVLIDKGDINIHEHFLGFLSVERSTSQQLFDFLLRELDNPGLPLASMRGQGYDNGANMKGEQAGVQAKIRNLNPRAFLISCDSHSLNLVVNDMAKSSLEGANFFHIVQKLYSFFSSSTFRWAIFLKQVEQLTLKPFSDTRWESRIDAIMLLRYQIGQVYDALLSIYVNKDIDSSIRDEVSGLVKQIQPFRFLCSVVIWYEVLNHISRISELMQVENYDIALAIKLLESSNLFFY
ncbi:Zinc finger MYM-type protein 1 [Araneus ventricosus]|uniref:Zinc finger MYM-type protein 1 n=1 Tax=Araneus ventricosus TaxID=182803 RepID=A0A4Y2KNG4_ARAVE|nr:Zinc finger MYM-type protein 1 [Araneus ventricosus]